MPPLSIGAGGGDMAEGEFAIRAERFRRCVRTGARVERLFAGCRWAEGSAYFPTGSALDGAGGARGDRR